MFRSFATISSFSPATLASRAPSASERSFLEWKQLDIFCLVKLPIESAHSHEMQLRKFSRDSRRNFPHSFRAQIANERLPTANTFAIRIVRRERNRSRVHNARVGCHRIHSDGF